MTFGCPRVGDGDAGSLYFQPVSFLKQGTKINRSIGRFFKNSRTDLKLRWSFFDYLQNVSVDQTKSLVSFLKNGVYLICIF